ncbi:MAG: hypothetical protein ACI4QA_03235 [Candidatus Spyradosoma sp.]
MDDRKRLFLKIRLRVTAKTYVASALLLALFAGIAAAEILFKENNGARNAVREATRARADGDETATTLLPTLPFAENPDFADFINARRS